VKRKIRAIYAVPIALLFLAALTSCDFLGLLTITNETGGDVRIRFYMYATCDSVFVDEVKLPDEEGSNEYVFRIGLNQIWTDERIEQYVGNIQKIEFITPAGTTVIEGREKLFKYIKKHRSRCGIPARNRVNISIEK
jgi:hypothetical protein